MYLIKVDGNILAESGRHCAQNWIVKCCHNAICGREYHFDEQTHSVKGDLILSNDRRAIPYATYYTEDGYVRAKSGTADLVAYSGYKAALFYYRESIDNISNTLRKACPEEFSDNIYKSLYIDVWATLELLLSDLILCLIYQNDRVLDKALDYCKVDKNQEMVEIENKVHKFFYVGMVYHRFDKVKKMYNDILGVVIPNTTDLKEFIHKRNNIVHRSSLSGKDRMDVTRVSLDDISNLISVVETFVKNTEIEVAKQY